MSSHGADGLSLVLGLLGLTIPVAAERGQRAWPMAIWYCSLGAVTVIRMGLRQAPGLPILGLVFVGAIVAVTCPLWIEGRDGKIFGVAGALVLAGLIASFGSLWMRRDEISRENSNAAFNRRMVVALLQSRLRGAQPDEVKDAFAEARFEVIDQNEPRQYAVVDATREHIMCFDDRPEAGESVSAQPPGTRREPREVR